MKKVHSGGKQDISRSPVPPVAIYQLFEARYEHVWLNETKPSLVTIMAWSLFGAKPLAQPLLTYCQMDHYQQLSLKCRFLTRKWIWKCHLWCDAICPGFDVLTPGDVAWWPSFVLLSWYIPCSHCNQLQDQAPVDFNLRVNDIRMTCDDLTEWVGNSLASHDDVIIWKLFPRYWPFARGTGEQRPVTHSFDVFFNLHLNKRLCKRWWGWWFDTPLRSLWRHCKCTNGHQDGIPYSFVISIIIGPGNGLSLPRYQAIKTHCDL